MRSAPNDDLNPLPTPPETRTCQKLGPANPVIVGAVLLSFNPSSAVGPLSGLRNCLRDFLFVAVQLNRGATSSVSCH
jgi:hypothetical protein